MTEREKKEVCKGYADLIIRKEQLIREIWKTEFGIRNLEDVLKRNKKHYICNTDILRRELKKAEI